MLENNGIDASINKVDYVYDDPNVDVYIKKYDYQWFPTSYDSAKKYQTYWNRLLIGSAGNPTTWDGIKVISKKTKS